MSFPTDIEDKPEAGSRARQAGRRVGPVLSYLSASLKAYVATTGAVLGLITLAHIFRAFAEGPHVATDPVFVLLTVATGGLALWAWCLMKRSQRS